MSQSHQDVTIPLIVGCALLVTSANVLISKEKADTPQEAENLTKIAKATGILGAAGIAVSLLNDHAKED